MHDIRLRIFALATPLFLLGTAAAAAAEMTGEEVKALITGKTVYLELGTTSTGGTGQGAIFYSPDGAALYRTASGAIWHGTWTIRGNNVCIDWKEAPNNACTKYDKIGSTITIVNSTTGQARGKVAKAVDGNIEKLSP
jgi:hypothetical protein